MIPTFIIVTGPYTSPRNGQPKAKVSGFKIVTSILHSRNEWRVLCGIRMHSNWCGRFARGLSMFEIKQGFQEPPPVWNQRWVPEPLNASLLEINLAMQEPKSMEIDGADHCKLWDRELFMFEIHSRFPKIATVQCMVSSTSKQPPSSEISERFGTRLRAISEIGEEISFWPLKYSS